MPLVIQFHDDLACPTIVCDWCQQPITQALAYAATLLAPDTAKATP